MKTYRNAMNDAGQAGLLCLFGSTEMIVSRFRRQGGIVTGSDEKGAELIRTPMREPFCIRPTAHDSMRG